MSEKKSVGTSDGSNDDSMTTQRFLRDQPPGTDFVKVRRTPLPSSPNAIYAHHWEDIVLHCSECKGDRSFTHPHSDWNNLPNYIGFHYISYLCRNCTNEKHTFAICLYYESSKPNELLMFKLGQDPAFGERLPDRLLSIAGNERNLFLKGKRAENQGMGIAAFAYYRRIVDAHKDKLFSEIIRVAKLDSQYFDFAQELIALSSESQFTKAVEKIKGAIPESLKIQGESPLTLIYNALSEGLHNESDEECLEIAHDIRVILSALMEKIETATKNDNEIATALANLHRRRKAKS